MRPRLLAAALGNYWRPVFVRENQMLLSAAMFSISAVMGFALQVHFIRLHGVRALFAHQSPAVMMWWLMSFMLTGGVARHYWRQITAGIAAAVPGLIDAEYAAILLMFALVLGVLTAPFIALGAPVIGSMALASIAMVVGGAAGATVPTGQVGWVRRLSGLAMLPFFFLAFIPGMLGRVVFAPPSVAAVILLIGLGLIGSGLRYFPAKALLQTDALEGAIERQGVKSANINAVGGIFAALGRVLRWQPRWMGLGAVPTTMRMRVGPLGALVGQCVLTGLMLAVNLALAARSGDTSHHIMAGLRGALPQSLIFGLFISGQWLMIRTEWPFFFMVGQHHGRLGFARLMFRAHRLHALQMAGSSGLLAVLMAAILGHAGIFRAGLAGLVVTSLVFGLSYCAAVPLLWRRFGGKPVIVLFQMLGALIGLFSIEFGIFFHGFQPVVLGIGVLAVGFGLVIERVAARRLAEMDWPLETETVMA